MPGPRLPLVVAGVVIVAVVAAARAAPAAPPHPPPAATWAPPEVGLACQAKLNAFCNDPVRDGPRQDGAYNASRAPFFGLYDHNGAPDGVYRAVAWRCYSHGCLNPETHRFDKTIAGPPSGPSRAANATACNIATDVGPGALQAICAACAGTSEGVSRGQCLPPPHVLHKGPARLPIQRAAPTLFTLSGNFSGATSAAMCRVNERNIGALTVVNASAARCEIPCNASSDTEQSAGCWLTEVPGTGTISVTLDGKAFSNELSVEFFHLALAQIGRRPYMDETTGSIVLRTDAAELGGVAVAVEASLPCVPGKRWSWPNVTGGTDVLLPLSLDGLPARLHNDLCVMVTLPSGEQLHLWRRFLRVPPLTANSTARVVQVDHESGGGLLVSTATNRTRTPLLGVGYCESKFSLPQLKTWMVQRLLRAAVRDMCSPDITEYGQPQKSVINAADEHPTNSTQTLIHEVQRMGRRGVTWALIYWCYCEHSTLNEAICVSAVVNPRSVAICDCRCTLCQS
eukprot:SAG31_NODE_1730_length_7424_cov_28.201911_8_plen_512_part_00